MGLKVCVCGGGGGGGGTNIPLGFKKYSIFLSYFISFLKLVYESGAKPGFFTLYAQIDMIRAKIRNIYYNILLDLYYI